MNAMAIESGKQAIYLQNLYHVYHGLGTAAYSSDLTELAYVNAYSRSKLSVDGHLQAFEGKLQNNIIRNVGHTIRVNEWWIGCSQNISENAGSGIASPLDEALTTIASTPHLETMLDGNFAAGSAIIDGYSNFESVGNSKLDADEITEAQERFLELNNLDIPASKLCAGLCNDYTMDYTYDNFYELATLSKENWINFMLEKYDLKGSPGANEYINMKYDEHTSDLCSQVYDGYDDFMEQFSYKVDRDELTQPQLEEVYLHFCKQVYDTDFTNALASYFSCSEKDVYMKHSDVLVELKNTLDHSSGIKRIEACKSYAEANNLPLKSCVRMYLRTFYDYEMEDMQKAIDQYKPYIDTTDLEAEFLF